MLLKCLGEVRPETRNNEGRCRRTELSREREKYQIRRTEKVSYFDSPLLANRSEKNKKRQKRYSNLKEKKRKKKPEVKKKPIMVTK